MLKSQLMTDAAASVLPKQYELRDFFGNPERSFFRLSPDGSFLGFMQPHERRKNIFVIPIPADGATPDFTQARQLTAETERDISGFSWKGNNHILYIKDFGGDENFHLLSADIHTGVLQDLTPYPKCQASVVDDLEDDPEHLLVQLNRRNPEIFDVYRISVRTAEATLVAENPGNITGWLTDHEGIIRIAVSTDGVNTSILYRPTEQDPFRTVLTTDFRTNVSPLFFTFDNSALYVLSNRGRDKTALVILDLDTGTETEPLFEHPEVDLGGASYSRQRKVLTSASFSTWKSGRHFFDKQTELLYAKLEARLPGYEIALQNQNLNEDTFIVATYNDRTLGARYIYGMNTDTLTPLGEINPQISELDMAPMQPVTYTTRDGLTIHGYLTIPLNSNGKNLPVIVHPHGGPWVRDFWGYDPEAQFLANRGFAVFKMNYRGSTGYGRAFWEKSFKQWGRAMQDDITDGVQWLIRQEIADPGRIGIYGGSYGGYATLAGVTYTPDLYAAAVDYVGVANLFTFMQTIPPYWKPYLDMMHEMVGDPEKDEEMMRAASPVFHVENIKTPLFIAQGANDPRVNKNESDQIVEALKNRGIEVQYMLKENEGHGFHNEENQFDFYGAMEEFFKRHLM